MRIKAAMEPIGATRRLLEHPRMCERDGTEGDSLKFMGGFMPQLTGAAAMKAATAGRKIIEAERRRLLKKGEFPEEGLNLLAANRRVIHPVA